MHTDNKKDFLDLGKIPTDGLDNTTITAQARYSVNIKKSREKDLLSLQYNAVNSFL